MGTKHLSTSKIVTKLRDSIRNSFQIKILMVSLGGVLFSILLSSSVFFLGMNKLTKDTSAEIEYGLGATSQQHLESQIEGTVEQLNLWMRHAQADLRILADITQKLFDHREEFIPMTEAVTEIPFFADKMQYYPEGGYSQNTPDEPSVVTVQTIYHDENGQIKPYPQQIIAETALLDLVMPAIHTQGAEKMWTYFTGDTNAAFSRFTPWVDYGRDAVEVYPEFLDVPYWYFLPGLVEAFQAWVQDSDPASTSYVTGIVPYVDGPTGELVQTFAYPLWNRERTRLAGAVWYDVSLDDIIGNIEEIELAETGFAFLAQADGNILAIPERGIEAMGMEEAAYFDEYQNLYRYLRDSSDPAIAALALSQDNVITTVNLQLATGEFVLIMHRLALMHIFSYDSQEIERDAWILGFLVPKDEINAPLIAAQTNVANSFESILMIQAMVLVVVVVLLIVLILFFAGRMTRGLASLSAGASQIAQGDFDTRVEILSIDEIGRLGNAFNEMARQLEESFDRIERRNIQLEKEVLERQQAEKELRKSRERLRHVVENMPVMMDAFDAEGNILVWNKECERVTGYSAEEIVNNPRAMELLYPDSTYREQMVTQWAELGNNYYNWEWELTAKDGTMKTVAWSNISDRLPIPGWATWGTGVDVTERVQTEEELKRYRGHLEELVRERTQELEQAQAELLRKERLATLGQFTATVAHEIRNPLSTVRTSIFAIGDAIERERVDQIPRALQFAERNIVRCDNIINELLDYTRGRTLRPRPTHIDTWLEGMLDELQSFPARQTIPEGIVCTRELNSGVNIPIDREHLRRAVVNVIDNAIDALQDQASAGNQMIVSTHVVGDRLEIRVSDTGPGIPDDVLPKVFEPLFSTKSFGVGLGLPVVRSIMEQHGGGVSILSKTAHDEKPGGTSVVLWLPVDSH
jgi:PAS domain S-box-containing protein